MPEFFVVSNGCTHYLMIYLSIPFSISLPSLLQFSDLAKRVGIRIGKENEYLVGNTQNGSHTNKTVVVWNGYDR